MKKIYTICLFALFSFLNAYGGSWSSGGGNGVLYPDGSIRLIDLLDESEYPTQTPSKGQRDKVLKSVGTSGLEKAWIFKDFKNIASKEIGRWRHLSPEFFDDMLYRIRFTNAKFMKSHQLANLIKDLPKEDSIYSPTLPSEKQVPIAIYVMQQVIFIAPIYDRLSEQDKRAVVIHEALRQYNFSIDSSVQENFDTLAIERATKILMGPASQNRLDEFQELIGYSEYSAYNDELHQILQETLIKVREVVKADLRKIDQLEAAKYLEERLNRIDEIIAVAKNFSLKNASKFSYELDDLVHDFVRSHNILSELNILNLNLHHQVLLASETAKLLNEIIVNRHWTSPNIIQGLQFELCLQSRNVCR